MVYVTLTDMTSEKPLTAWTMDELLSFYPEAAEVLQRQGVTATVLLDA